MSGYFKSLYFLNKFQLLEKAEIQASNHWSYFGLFPDISIWLYIVLHKSYTWILAGLGLLWWMKNIILCLDKQIRNIIFERSY